MRATPPRPITRDEARADLQTQLEHYLAGGELLPPIGLALEEEAIDVAAAVAAGSGVQEAVDAAWAAFEEMYPA